MENEALHNKFAEPIRIKNISKFDLKALVGIFRRYFNLGLIVESLKCRKSSNGSNHLEKSDGKDAKLLRRQQRFAISYREDILRTC